MKHKYEIKIRHRPENKEHLRWCVRVQQQFDSFYGSGFCTDDVQEIKDHILQRMKKYTPKKHLELDNRTLRPEEIPSEDNIQFESDHKEITLGWLMRHLNGDKSLEAFI